MLCPRASRHPHGFSLPPPPISLFLSSPARGLLKDYMCQQGLCGLFFGLRYTSMRQGSPSFSPPGFGSRLLSFPPPPPPVLTDASRSIELILSRLGYSTQLWGTVHWPLFRVLIDHLRRACCKEGFFSGPTRLKFFRLGNLGETDMD
jgi:hypothetical protein